MLTLSAYGNGGVMATLIERHDGTLTLLVHLTFKRGRDDSLIELVLAAPHGCLASYIREAMRSGVNQNNDQIFQTPEEDFTLPDIGTEL